MRCEGNSYKEFWEKVVFAIKKDSLIVASPPLGIILPACDAQNCDNHLTR